jgi:hypothetical protein
VQPLFAATTPLQLLLTVNPADALMLMPAAALPELVTLTACAIVTSPTPTAPNVSVEGDALIDGFADSPPAPGCCRVVPVNVNTLPVGKVSVVASDDVTGEL